MAIIQGANLAEINALKQEIDRFFNNYYPVKMQENQEKSIFPLVEMKETNDTIYLKLDVSGIDKQDLNVQATPEAIMISGECCTETTIEEKGRKQSEFRQGQFRRVIPLPTNIKNTQVQGQYKDGLLCLTLPKAEAEQDKSVQVNLS
jgi:HSP20 family protein